MPLQWRYVGTQEGQGFFTPKDTDNEVSVECRLDEEEKYIDYRDGREHSAGSELVGEMWPVPDDVRIPKRATRDKTGRWQNLYVLGFSPSRPY